MPTPSVLLVELISEERFAAVKAVMYPFIAGYLDQVGIPVSWLCFSSEEQPAAEHPFVMDLGPEARQRLAAEMEACWATHLMLSERPTPALDEFLAASFPSAVRFDLGNRDRYCETFSAAWLHDWLGLPEPAPTGELPDVAEPRYVSRAMDRLVARHPPPVTVVAGHHCLYAAPLTRNPHYQDLDLSSLPRKSGCAFCPGPPELQYRLRTPPLDLVVSQISVAAESAESGHSGRVFVIQSARAFRGLTRLIDRLEPDGLSGIELHFSCRADELLRRADAIEELLPRAQRLGYQIHVWSIGAENLSPEENERLNKGITPEQLCRARRLLLDWEQRYPETFFFSCHGGFGFILFTPWTTLEDLRRNLAGARELGVETHAFFLTRRLMLLPDSAIHLLAQRDGLLIGDDPQAIAEFDWLVRFCDPGCQFWPEDGDPPWRFKDPLVAAVCAITVRLAGPESPVEGDPYHRRIQTIGARYRNQVDLLTLFGHLLDVAAEHDGPPEVAALLDAYEARLTAALGPGTAPTHGPVDPALPKAYQDALRRLERASGNPLRGFQVVAVQVTATRVALTFERYGQKLRLFLLPDKPGLTCFRRRGGTALLYEKTPVAETPDGVAVMEVVLRVFTRARPRGSKPPR